MAKQWYTRIYRGIQGYTWVCSGMQEYTRVYWGIQDICGIYNRGYMKYLRIETPTAGGVEWRTRVNMHVNTESVSSV